MSPPPNSPDAVARQRRIAARRGAVASVGEYLRRKAPPVRRRELEQDHARACAVRDEDRARLAEQGSRDVERALSMAPYSAMPPASPLRQRETTQTHTELHRQGKPQ